MIIQSLIRRWGINLRSVLCPRCDERMPALRIPDSMAQMLWGGWTCNHCGCRMDKWGEPIESFEPFDV